MAGLVDMEELLSEVSNKEIVDYMREALACYNNSAYRGCIVMSYLALFDDIRAKLVELAKVNAIAKKVSKEVEKRANGQEIFETYMADQIRAEGLITEAEHQRLALIRDLRNKAAHPSGVHATAEEARFVYRTVISEFLSKQLLKTTHAVDAVIERLDKANLFPTSKIDEIKAIAADEVSGLHLSAFPYLIHKLVEASKATEATTSENAERLIVGIAAQRSPDFRPLLRKAIVVGKAHDSGYANLLGRLVAADAKLLDELSPEIRLRTKALLLQNAEQPATKAVTKLSHPARQLGHMIEVLISAES
jgi:hypothetical protein